MEIPINKLEDCFNMAKHDVINTNYYGLKTRRPTFTTKHYVKIAAYIKAYGANPIAQKRLCEPLADMFAKDNPRFRRLSFYEACGLYDVASEREEENDVILLDEISDEEIVL